MSRCACVGQLDELPKSCHHEHAEQNVCKIKNIEDKCNLLSFVQQTIHELNQNVGNCIQKSQVTVDTDLTATGENSPKKSRF